MPEPSKLQQDKLSSIYIQQYNIEHLTFPFPANGGEKPKRT